MLPASLLLQKPSGYWQCTAGSAAAPAAVLLSCLRLRGVALAVPGIPLLPAAVPTVMPLATEQLEVHAAGGGGCCWGSGSAMLSGLMSLQQQQEAGSCAALWTHAVAPGTRHMPQPLPQPRCPACRLPQASRTSG